MKGPAIPAKAQVAVETTTTTKTTYKMTEYQIGQACLEWLAKHHGVDLKADTDIEFDCSMGGMLRDATIIVKKTTTEAK